MGDSGFFLGHITLFHGRIGVPIGAILRQGGATWLIVLTSIA